MPNWVVNKLTIEGDNLDKIIEQHTTTEDNKIMFDFDTIDQMPEELDIEKSSRSYDGFKLYIAKINPLIPNLGVREDKILPFDNFIKKVVGLFGDDCLEHSEKYILKPSEIEELKKKYNDEIDSVLKLGEKAFSNIEKYGYSNWYDWRIEHWGTKWNASNTYIYGQDEKTIYFDTAWSPAVPVVEKFAKLHPELKITHEYAEEQIGLFCGKHEYQNGQVQYRNDYEEFSKEAYELSFELWGCEELYRFDKEINNYVYIDNEDSSNAELE